MAASDHQSRARSWAIYVFITITHTGLLQTLIPKLQMVVIKENLNHVIDNSNFRFPPQKKTTKG